MKTTSDSLTRLKQTSFQNRISSLHPCKGSLKGILSRFRLESVLNYYSVNILLLMEFSPELIIKFVQILVCVKEKCGRHWYFCCNVHSVNDVLYCSSYWLRFYCDSILTEIKMWIYGFYVDRKMSTSFRLNCEAVSFQLLLSDNPPYLAPAKCGIKFNIVRGKRGKAKFSNRQY